MAKSGHPPRTILYERVLRPLHGVNDTFPYAQTLIVHGNTYLIWAMFWIQFVTTISSFSYFGNDLGYQIQETPYFGLTLPELFFAVSIALCTYVILYNFFFLKRQHTSFRIKSFILTALFSAICLGFSYSLVQWKHQSYRLAKFHYPKIIERAYKFKLSAYPNGNEDSFYLSCKKEADKLQQNIKRYEEQYPYHIERP